jgi:hypothetical protein
MYGPNCNYELTPIQRYSSVEYVSGKILSFQIKLIFHPSWEISYFEWEIYHSIFIYTRSNVGTCSRLDKALLSPPRPAEQIIITNPLSINCHCFCPCCLPVHSVTFHYLPLLPLPYVDLSHASCCCQPMLPQDDQR